MFQNENSLCLSKAKEHVMALRLLDDAHKFFQDPENVKKFEEWKRIKQLKINLTYDFDSI